MIEQNAVPDAETYEGVRELAVQLVHGGFTDFDEAVEAVVDHFTGGETSVGAARAAAVVTAVWTERLAEQRGWPSPTEAERLLAVLDGLRDRDLVAEAHFTCCGSCGTAEIGGYATEASRGFVFFHRQDTDSAVAGRGLMLAFGGFDGTAEGTREVGREVVGVLADAGFPVEWNGSADRRILVAPLEWRIPVDGRPGPRGGGVSPTGRRSATGAPGG